MKNHEWVDGRLLQTNKKWSALKQSQCEWIYEVTREIHALYISENDRLPMKKRKEDVISTVYDRVCERGIWIPYGEFSANVKKYIDRLNHKSPLFILPKPKNKKSANVKPPAPPKATIDEIPQEACDLLKQKFISDIRNYIKQTGKIPPNKVRDGNIKNITAGFNAKQWKTYEKKLRHSDELVFIYDELKQEVFRQMQSIE